MSEQADDKPFRIYTVNEIGLPKCVATCDGDSLGFALLTLEEEGELEGEVGILHRPNPGISGDWLINPYGRKL